MKKLLFILFCLFVIFVGFFTFSKWQKRSQKQISKITPTPVSETFKLAPKTKPTTIPKNENDFYSQIGENIKELFK